jgi:hypothetical protein
MKCMSAWDYGVPLAVIQNLASYWETSFDCVPEHRINKFDNYRIELQNVGVHPSTSVVMDHIGSNVDHHGWPSSFLEMPV